MQLISVISVNFVYNHVERNSVKNEQNQGLPRLAQEGQREAIEESGAKLCPNSAELSKSVLQRASYPGIRDRYNA